MDAPPRATVRPPARRDSHRSSAMETGEMEQARDRGGYPAPQRRLGHINDVGIYCALLNVSRCPLEAAHL